MQKRNLAVCCLAAAILLCAGCTKHDRTSPTQSTGTPSPSTVTDTEEPTSAPSETQPALPRVDAAGNPIETGYAEGTLSEITETTLTLDEAGEAHTFTLSPRAKNDLSVLELAVGMRIIINFEPGTEGSFDEAVSLEKILQE